MIPLLRPSLPRKESWLKYLEASENSHQLSNFGPCWKQAKRRLSEMTGSHAVPVSNGTLAIQLAIQMTFTPGSYIAVPDFTFVGTVNAILSAGCIPVFLPCDPLTWTISRDKLMGHRDHFDGFLVVSPFGYRVDFASYDNISEQTGKRVVYDLAGGFGMYVPTKNPYSYSFHSTKNLRIGEGGAACFSDEETAEIARRITVFGYSPDREIVHEYGMNGKLDEVRSAILCAALDEMDDILFRIERKKRLISEYQDFLSEECAPHELYNGGAPCLAVLAGLDGKLLEAKGKEEGVEFKRYYYPILSHCEAFSHFLRLGESPDFFDGCVAFPSDIDDNELATVKDFLRRNLFL